jgi:hypothetical protein
MDRSFYLGRWIAIANAGWLCIDGHEGLYLALQCPEHGKDAAGIFGQGHLQDWPILSAVCRDCNIYDCGEMIFPNHITTSLPFSHLRISSILVGVEIYL